MRQLSALLWAEKSSLHKKGMVVARQKGYTNEEEKLFFPHFTKQNRNFLIFSFQMFIIKHINKFLVSKFTFLENISVP